MKALQQQAFVYGENPVRTVTIKKEIWFVAKDICNVLEIANHRDAVSRLDDDERESVLVDTLGGPQEMNTVNEPGLYSLILTSRKPEAKAFKRWITHEVLPAIRKTGAYTSKTGSFPWMDSLGITLRQEARLSSGLTKPEKLRLRAGLLRQTQEETGHSYTDIISILESSAEAQEQKIIQLAERAVHREAREEARSITRQAKQALVWLKEEYAAKGAGLAVEKDGYLLVRYDLWKMWAGRHRFNLTQVLRELHRQGVVEALSEGGKIRYGQRRTRVEGKCVSVVWVLREAVLGDKEEVITGNAFFKDYTGQS